MHKQNLGKWTNVHLCYVYPAVRNSVSISAHTWLIPEQSAHHHPKEDASVWKDNFLVNYQQPRLLCKRSALHYEVNIMPRMPTVLSAGTTILCMTIYFMPPYLRETEAVWESHVGGEHCCTHGHRHLPGHCVKRMLEQRGIWPDLTAGLFLCFDVHIPSFEVSRVEWMHSIFLHYMEMP